MERAIYALKKIHSAIKGLLAIASFMIRETDLDEGKKGEREAPLYYFITTAMCSIYRLEIKNRT